jgi:S1-C subfamily serine protease
VPGDLVIAVGGERVESSEDIAAIVEQFNPGDQVPITLLRGREQVVLNVPIFEHNG